jgi:ATP-binding cassette, subfamily A (ABC1), member 3
MNLTSQDVAAAYPQFLYEAILQRALGKPNLKFKMTT